MEFGERLRELRKQAKMSQRELASQVGIDFTYLSKIENSLMNPPSEETIEKIANVLEVDRQKLILLAKKVPSDLQDFITSNPRAVEALRVFQRKKYSSREWKHILRELKSHGETTAKG